MINFRDFFPEAVEKNLFGQPTQFESMKGLIVTVNQWIVDNRIDVISIETLIVPKRSVKNYKLVDEAETELLMPAAGVNQLQVIRIWYHE